jgi:hypothetical protein
LIDAQCAAFDLCCQATGEPSDPASCKAFFALFAGGSSVGPNAAACEALLRERTADGSYCTLGAVKDGVDICHNALGDASDNTSSGTKPPGALCEDDDECLAPAGGTARCASKTTFDDQHQSTTTRSCAQTTRGGLGDGPCSSTVRADGSSSVSYSSNTEPLDTTVECYEADGLFCPMYGQTCESYAEIGKECADHSRLCNPRTSFCRSNGSGAQSICTALRAVGETCTGSSECGSETSCREGVCAPLKQNGEACSVSSECASDSCVNLKCGGYGGGTLCFHD